ncbi:hypothetical protein QT995_27315, partial [Microcoleus sp. S36b_A3]
FWLAYTITNDCLFFYIIQSSCVSAYIINIGELVRYSGSVPDWVTGINGNPLAGAAGLLFLSVLAVGMRKISQ